VSDGLTLVVAVAAALGIVAVGLLGWLAVVSVWAERRTRGLAYFGLPLEKRRRFDRRLRRQARLLGPLLRAMGRVLPFDFERVGFRHRGVAAPRGSCSPESFEAGIRYRPRPDDVFVATQMRSGTTWMQYLVYQLLTRGRGDLVDRGRTLNAVSPWLEAEIGVPVREAPTVGGERPRRIVKTHLPARLCPWSADARYIYVVRHPLSCLASCVDFLEASLGAWTPELDDAVEWFCSDDAMWRGGRPAHVEGWWTRASDHDNVLFVRFEEMLADLPAVAGRLASFLGLVPPTPDELATISERTRFETMRTHASSFLMAPPSLLSSAGRFFVKGTADRHEELPDEVRMRVARGCRQELEEGGVPLASWYPDLFDRESRAP